MADSVDDYLDFADLEDKYYVAPEEGLDNIVLIDGAPIVPEAKKSALLRVLGKLFGSCGTVKEDGIVMPFEEQDGKSMSKGFLFVEYETPEQAANAAKTLNGKKLDKQHTLLANLLEEVDKFANVDDEFVAPEETALAEQEHLRSWMADQAGRDQLVMFRGDEVSIVWNKKSEQPETVVSRMGWTETYTSWSPLGSYLASFHQQGLQLWGGPSWKRIARFQHPKVKLIDFSPQENYLVTWSNEGLELPPPGHPARKTIPFTQEDEGKHVFVWDLKKGILLRSFAALPTEPSQPGQPAKKMRWPMLKWSADEKYVARLTPGQQISVYEVPSMNLLDKKSIKVDGVVDFEWSPAPASDKKAGADGDLLAYWTPEVNNQPARVSVMSIPSKEVVRTKNLYSVTDCKMHWQSAGDYLCIKVDRHTKSKKGSFTNMEIFRINEKNIPVEVIEIKETIIEFAWEPKGARFAVIQTMDPNLGQPNTTLKTVLAFYAFESSKARAEANFKLVRSVDRKTVNTLHWAPKGRFLVAATLGSSTTFDLEFWDVDFEGDKKDDERDFAANLQCLATAEHYGVTDLQWDPSGRYVVTSSSVWKHKMENGYTIWDFKGQQIREERLDNFKQIIWRPRPPTYLSKQEQKEIRKKLRDYSKIFDEEDNLEQNTAAREQQEERRRLLQEYQSWREGIKQQVAEERKKLGKPHWSERLLGQEENEEVEELLEQVVSEHTEVV
ncbi:eukaryotic translation initiation factor 3 [Protomyces lactucae-debilis]|uniref:Eukaryotic translation initiation factor 3 subunit B n=1 Tax=Protomyces lactucae-debilis TaxID=2754530 RepID=A0A1Y2FF09_PROLT|nr:eukaryotic translation initiation factor 3 [Protomyces lactucae-debilis]ORY82509.1 eukaryotic translation initiation factor 3 [Protomyces lactucae-debilis]